MGFTLRLILGVFLILQSCGLPSVAHPRSIRETSNQNSTLKRDVDVTEKNLLDLEFGKKVNDVNKESKPKTDNKVNNVNISDTHSERKLTVNDLENVPKNLTTVKLEKSESYRKSDPSFFQVTSTSTTTENVIDETVKEVKPEEKGRSIDVDIDKYVSPEFHNINNVYTVSSSPDTEKFVDDDFIHKSKSAVHKNVINHSEDHSIDLTTPRTDFFDNKYKEAMDSVNQQLEHLDVEPIGVNSHDNEDEASIDKLIEKTDDQNATTKLDYVKVKNIEINNVANKTKVHNDLTVEEATKINFESSYNDTKIIPEPNEKLNKIIQDSSSKEIDSNSEIIPIETSTSKTLLLTTRKPVKLTKPPNNRNISHILSNKIEVDTLKKSNLLSEILTTTEDDVVKTGSSTRSTIDITKRGTVKYADYATTTESFTFKTTNKNKIIVQSKFNNSIEQVVQENQVIPVHVTVPVEEDQTVTDSTTVEVRLKIEGKPSNDETTTEIETTTVVSTTELVTTSGKEEDDDTTQNTATEINITDIPITEINDKTEFGNVPTESAISESTTITTLENRFSGTDIPITEIIGEATPITIVDVTDVPVTELNNSTIFETKTTTELFKNNKSEEMTLGTDIPFTETFPSTLEITTSAQPHETILSTTESEIEITTILPQSSSSVPIKFDFTTQPTKNLVDTTMHLIETTTLKTIIDNDKIEEPTTEYIPQETTLVNRIDKNHPTTKQVIIYHIENVDNHTTLLPEVINPGYNYPTPDIVDNSPKLDISNSTQGTLDDDASTEAAVDEPEDNKGTIAAIIISSVGAVCLVVLAGLLFIMRKRQKRFNYGERCTPVSLDDYSMDNVSVYNSVRRKGAARASKRSYGNPAFDDPVAVTHPLNFPALAKFSSNFEDIKAEFEEIPQISARISELPEGCETKNRYANVIPLPETRVFLNAIEGYPNSDYINANYVTGPKNTKGYYIACQGPMQNTVDDFWRMIWEQQSKVILMLTQLFENGIEKCVDYLPPSEVLDCHRLFGDFQVTLKKREVKDKYIISSLQLKNMVSNSWREVTHFWYLGWPDKGVPKEANSIIAFLIEARSFMKSTTIDKKNGINGVSNGSAHTDVNPVVVHCSPGTGRTGVVIACDIAIREFEKTRLVDIPRIVYKIRRDRASSVQTKEQYEFIYKVVSLYAAKLTGGALDSI